MRLRQRLFCAVFCILLLLQGCAGEPEQTETQSKLLPNKREASDFTVENGFVRYPGAMLGVDVSSHQEQIDWEAVRRDGITFAILQLGYRGYTEGELYEDERYRENLEGARKAGLKVGVYFFSQALSVEEAEAEAEFVLKTLDSEKLDFPVFYDWEEVSSGRTGGKLSSAITDYAKAFCDLVSAQGYQTGVYFNQVYGYFYLRLEELYDRMFWVAEYRDAMTFSYDAAMWQYTSSGSVNGIKTRADIDLYFPEGT